MVLDLPTGNLSDAPVVYDLRQEGLSSKDAFKELNRYLTERFDLKVVRLPISAGWIVSPEHAIKFPDNFIPEGTPWILVGKTKKDTVHATVVMGGKIVFARGQKIIKPSSLQIGSRECKAWYYYFVIPSTGMILSLIHI